MRSTWFLVAGLAACGGNAGLKQTGAALTVDYFGDTDVVGFHFEVTQVSCAGETVEGTVHHFNVDLVDGIFPGNIAFIENTFDAASRHLGSDMFVSLPPGCYDILAAPAASIDPSVDPSDATSWTPSEDCSVASASGIEVLAGVTTEADPLISQCDGDAIGAVDQLVLLNHPPSFSLEIDEKFNYECETVTVCAEAYDVDDDPIDFEFLKTDGASLFGAITTTKSVIRFEDGHRVWEICADITPRYTDSYEFKLSVWDVDQDGNAIEDALDGLTSRAELSFPIHTNWIEDPLCFDAAGDLVPAAGVEIVRAEGCAITDAETWYCDTNCGGSLQPDCATQDHVCDANGDLIEANLYPTCPTS